jgi:hypothetical protein
MTTIATAIVELQPSIDGTVREIASIESAGGSTVGSWKCFLALERADTFTFL